MWYIIWILVTIIVILIWWSIISADNNTKEKNKLIKENKDQKESIQELEKSKKILKSNLLDLEWKIEDKDVEIKELKQKKDKYKKRVNNLYNTYKNSNKNLIKRIEIFYWRKRTSEDLIKFVNKETSKLKQRQPKSLEETTKV